LGQFDFFALLVLKHTSVPKGSQKRILRCRADFRCKKTTCGSKPDDDWYCGPWYGSCVQSIDGLAVSGGLAFFGSKSDNQWVLLDEVVFVFFRTECFPSGPRAPRNAGPHHG